MRRARSFPWLSANVIFALSALGLSSGCNSDDEHTPRLDASIGHANDDVGDSRDAQVPVDPGDTGAGSDSGTQTLDAGAGGLDGAAEELDAEASDAAAGDWDASDGDENAEHDASLPDDEDTGSAPGANPRGRAYAETSFTLVKPAGLKAVLEQATSLIGNGRLFVNEYRAGSGSTAVVVYGAADAVTGSQVRWQFPSAQRYSFTAAPVRGEPTRYRSEPFTYRMLARVKILFSTRQVGLAVVDTIYDAKFDTEFQAIEAGTLKGVLPRSLAEQTSFQVGPLCSQFCPSSFCTSHGVNTLADVLDCQNSTMDVDRDGDGRPDAYAMELAFRSQRVTLVPHPDDL
jgi:hypothetical protein